MSKINKQGCDLAIKRHGNAVNGTFKQAAADWLKSDWAKRHDCGSMRWIKDKEL